MWKWILPSLLLSVGICRGQEKIHTPTDILTAVHKDMQGVPRTLLPHTRWLLNHKYSEKVLDKRIRTLRGHLHHLTRSEDFIQFPTTKDGLVMRINLKDLGWNEAVWEKLANSEPYFHNEIIEEVGVKVWQGGKWPGDNVYYAPGAFKYTFEKEIKRTTKIDFSEILRDNIENRILLEDIAHKTRSKIPFVYSDWFFNQSAAQEDRDPGYYDFLQVKDEKDFQKLVGYTELFPERLSKLRGAVSKSGVTLAERAILREEAIGGPYYRSFDFKYRKAKGKKNPLRILGDDIQQEYDATEQYGLLPNKMWATGLFDRQGKRQATAPSNIASNGSSKSNDRNVHVNVSCTICHDNGGLKDIDEWARNLYQPPFRLKSLDYDLELKLKRQHLRSIQPFLKLDRLRYEEAVKTITGFSSKEYAAAYAELWEFYEDADVDLQWAARDLGVTPKELKDGWTRQLKRVGYLDDVLSGIMLEGPRRKTISISQWEESFQIGYLSLRGYDP